MDNNKKEAIINEFYKGIENYVEKCNGTETSISFKTRDGKELSFSSFEALAVDPSDFTKTIGMLYPYYDIKSELPLTAWGTYQNTLRTIK